MSHYINVVKFKVQEGEAENFETLYREQEMFDGLEKHYFVKTGESSYCWIGIWETEASVIAARPQMIAFLDSFRDMLEEISPELGVTDPVSGPVIFQEECVKKVLG